MLKDESSKSKFKGKDGKGKSGKFSDCNPKFAKEKGSKVSKDSGGEADEEEEDSRMRNTFFWGVFFCKKQGVVSKAHISLTLKKITMYHIP